MTADNRYGGDIFAGHARRARRVVPTMAAERDVVVEDAATGFCGAVVGFERTYDGDFVRLEDGRGVRRLFAMREAAFLVDGSPVTLTRPAPTRAVAPTRSASGSTRVENVRAKVALPSRIWVEGIHDAAIVERVWGHDLRVEGVVVEHLEGLDNLADRLQEFGPGPGRRVGVLVDHLVDGSKEDRLTRSLGPYVTVTGHPYIDVWEAVKPGAVGIEAWPRIPRGTDWKTGICRELGWGTPQDGWRRVYGAVSSFRDLEAPLIGAVERLVDFVTLGDENGETGR
ncbi:DUF3097 domain-containing protein [Rhodococcus sp. BP-349]|uniref:DUF3097 domain-containing protein n=1 Tax=unclassified Rhodococcus (in: high G+C Gram-positive bacteria) TaxID=192944 RepID=UPI001C9A5C0C|nr:MULTISPECIES: DUF3097 domain-containing protein [unclassified Rhodococcus (in: high G+C Gram-positive bacteria)]MBY6541213.1 DUF3097 domain-containing protein [Rhodococcus sp. BP-363]MBY6544761.1 DUF3097 domain-containing protein [Rhodococcus sp. BP-369]MBY6563991.1 DUF3097 domain-containing protein [Rhodococcus sp. BP-370]MBY6579072.1 DUF3097 domain-containing protein [Rhodococcus sp. BP-364]MBY6588373.1 DUF3097 domain-containing protein [Rhodococcus sp. BP-358]